ncbi:hypothetical protein B2D45_13020 [Lactobacillus hilgardii]|uniref:Uncharacterized protein n=1 Tax=Lentilactobacillus hilgardii (strain ATCC 8290 / DSM 20176 / CCUG 30140 / JCM 1155 / KCTC 3500 / NBRC 15886 / NCIMB 8040 / NRRL B-1843 / 9) TaxID=1423757 RepID=C0XHU5_LENH9|nr:hypothetical protein HMPREF0519_0806 [Lentilactobacillus hilgardii DSM 20176 = ATCC 8290]KRK55268.1 hypothetical protein FD42_GL000976 [Lentilactobacillus hilgardii DSM 20176 = ATCC 8290]QEU39504.1 hypothetical protein LH500_11855 [Lentilactobacillus hilgardii]TDG84901.1 hypothetical protein C5L34_001176 [Lentilactobacillus hilgardii]
MIQFDESLLSCASSNEINYISSNLLSQEKLFWKRLVYVVRIEATNNILPAILEKVNSFSKLISTFLEKTKKAVK